MYPKIVLKHSTSFKVLSTTGNNKKNVLHFKECIHDGHMFLLFAGRDTVSWKIKGVDVVPELINR